MKKILSSLLFLYFSFLATKLLAQSANIYTDGKYILGPCGDTLTLKGVNYAAYNWGYDINNLKISEIAKTGANAVRLPWYITPASGTLYANYVALDSLLSKCMQNKMIAILDVHDFTCGNTPNSVIAGAAWYTSAGVLPILLKYKKNLIINIANEALYYNWTSNPTAALATYKSTYETIITNLRSTPGFTFPLMIDAPDCGTNSDAFVANNTAQNMVSFDPLHTIIFSAHAYWYAFAANDSLQMANKINSVLALNIPLVMGEVANQQDDANPCQYNLNYKPLLNFLTAKKVGWLAWSWDNDICSNRQISTNGNYNSLTTYGQDIVNNSNYGLLNNTHRSAYLTNGNLCETTPLNLPEIEMSLNCEDDRISLNFKSNYLPSVQIKASADLNYWETIATQQLSNFEGTYYFNKIEKFTYYKAIVSLGLTKESKVIRCKFSQNGISVLPNPATTKVVVTAGSRIKSIQVFNEFGAEKFIEKNIDISEYTLSTAGFAEGVYWIRIIDETSRTQTCKFVIIR